MQNKEEIKKEKLLSALDNDYRLLSANGLKAKALEFYKKNNFPGLKDEGWRQTNLSPIFSDSYKELRLDKDINIDDFRINKLQADILVFMNGFYSEKHSEIISKEIQLGSIQKLATEYPEVFKQHFESTELLKENNFTALNTAYVHDGSFIYIKKNQADKTPIHILNISTGEEPVLVQLRNLLVTETSSEVEVIESFHSLNGNKSFSNIATEVIVGKNSSVKWLRIQEESEGTKHMNHMKVLQANDSNFTSNTITISGGLVRNSIQVKHTGEGCSTNLFGLYFAKNNQLFDNYTFIDHAVPHCESNQVYKGIIDDDASAVFFGKVLVAKDAQKTNANQSNRNVLLSENAKINSKPQLEIYADDVACSHGSTTGQLDQEALFYMQSRGIPAERARAMLLYGFVSEVLDEIHSDSVKEYIETEIRKILGEL